jgi:hypothetical protein
MMDMKRLENKIFVCLTSCIILGLISSCFTQKEKLEQIAVVKTIINNQDFKFVATSAQPQRTSYMFPFSNYNLFLNPMITQNLSGLYSLSVSKDSLNCYLPYFGVVNQSIPYNTSDQGIKFISTSFTYQKVENKKGDFNITIIPKDKQKANKFYLNVNINGYATLNVNFVDRDGISFFGNIQPITKN